MGAAAAAAAAATSIAGNKSGFSVRDILDLNPPTSSESRVSKSASQRVEFSGNDDTGEYIQFLT